MNGLIIKTIDDCRHELFYFPYQLEANNMKSETLRVARELKAIMGQESDWMEALTRMVDGDLDFYSSDDDWRIIRQDAALDILTEELAGDEYLLGCFYPSFLSEITGLPTEVFRILQKTDACEAAGKIVAAMGKVEALAKEYASQDGYGHHFACYDGNEYEINVDGIDYLMFRVN
jgi:predicted enzyme related to lactoylglutathione lyase